ncbi:MAG: NAD-dependent epimerase/dehydratase family protein [Deltaproteobacteria bacterium]|nr:NAD-dependent epimerase/dehydratase family protein [Deltaproteobacteria bacterium]
MRILVTGAAGYLGGKLARGLCEEDWVERVVGLDLSAPAWRHPKFSFHAQDVRAPLMDLLKAEEVDTVAHLAYVLPPMHDKNYMEEVNKGGTLNVLAAARAAHVRHILYTSSTTAYGFWPDNHVPLTEDSPLRGNDDFTYAKNKKEIETILEAFRRDNPQITLAILRPCFVVGPGFQNPLARHLQKRLVMLPAGAQPFQFVHEDDLQEVMLRFLKDGRGGVYNVAAPGVLTFREMVRMLGNLHLALPWPLIYGLTAVAWDLRLRFLTEFPSPALRLMVHPWIASAEKLVRDTGFSFLYDTRESFADFVRHVRGGGAAD